MPYLVRVKIDGIGAEQWELTVTKPFIVGRGHDANGQIADNEASRQHFQIVLKDGKYWIEDKKSRNGTFVNGKRQAGLVELKFGDRLRAGETNFVFEEHQRIVMSDATIRVPNDDFSEPDGAGTMINARVPKALKKE